MKWVLFLLSLIALFVANNALFGFRAVRLVYGHCCQRCNFDCGGSRMG